MDLEKMATTAVTNAISKTDRLKSFINADDKEPAFDGNIYIYANDNYAKKDVKQVSVQVKGKGTAIKNVKDKIKYSISVTDLEIYMNNGGTMFFVVYIDTNTRETKQIYYSALLPMKIKELLKLNDNKSSDISVKFQKMPTDTNELTSLFINFYSNAQKQISFVGKEIPTLEELEKSNKLESITFECLHNNRRFSEHEIPKLLANKEMYLYANVKDSYVPIPVEYYEEVDQISMSADGKLPVSVNGVKYYDSINNTITAEKIIYRIGTCVTLTLPNLTPNINPDKDFEVKLSIIPKGTLKERIIALEFVVAMFNAKSFEIAGHKVPADFSELELKKLNSSEYPYMLGEYKKAQKVFDKLNVTKDLNIDKCKDEDMRRLKVLIDAIEYGKPVKGLSKDIPLIAKYSVGNIELALVFKRNDDGTHNLWNFFDTYFPVVEEVDGEKIPISQFAILTADNLVTLDNINFKNIIDDFYRIDISESLINSANRLMLELIRAFDKKADRNYLDTAKQLLSLQMAHTEYIQSTICVLNELQIFARERALNFAEKKKLYNIIENNDDEFIKMGAYLLLDEQDEASKIIGKMDENQLKSLADLPIYKFYKEPQEENYNG